MRIRLLLLAVFSLLVVPTGRAAIGFGQVDTFQDGTTMNWEEGARSPNPPTNIATGGPAGAGDSFLRNISTGGGGSGSKMVMFNMNQWTGNYRLAGVDRITLHMANFGSATLPMRIALQSGTGTLYCSSVKTELPADGVWRVIDFDLTTSALTNIGGGDTVEQALSNVVDVRILAAAGGASFTGDPVAGNLGVDNIVGHDIANFVLRITGVSRPGGVPRIRFTTINGRSYRVEHSDSLTSPTWTPLSNGSSVAGTGQELEIDDLDGAGSVAARFYRVVLLP
jgi:hypothetical protein